MFSRAKQWTSEKLGLSNVPPEDEHFKEMLRVLDKFDTEFEDLLNISMRLYKKTCALVAASQHFGKAVEEISSTDTFALAPMFGVGEAAIVTQHDYLTLFSQSFNESVVEPIQFILGHHIKPALQLRKQYRTARLNYDATLSKALKEEKAQKKKKDPERMAQINEELKEQQSAFEQAKTAVIQAMAKIQADQSHQITQDMKRFMIAEAEYFSSSHNYLQEMKKHTVDTKRQKDEEVLPDDYAGYGKGTGQMFGASLLDIMELQKDVPNRIPLIMLALVRNIIKMDGTTTEGIFRLSAYKRDKDKMKNLFRRGEYDLEKYAPESVHVSAGVLKDWLRELKEPIFPQDDYRRCLEMGRKKDDVDLEKLMEELPLLNRFVICYLIWFLREFVKTSDVTRMTASNLALVFAPSFLRNIEQSEEAFALSSQEAGFVEFLLQSLKITVPLAELSEDELPPSPSEIMNPFDDPEDDDLTPISEEKEEPINPFEDAENKTYSDERKVESKNLIQPQPQPAEEKDEFLSLLGSLATKNARRGRLKSQKSADAKESVDSPTEKSQTEKSQTSKRKKKKKKKRKHTKPSKPLPPRPVRPAINPNELPPLPFAPVPKRPVGEEASSQDQEPNSDMPPNWEMHTDEDGDTYYWNYVTEVASWKRPNPDGSIPESSDESDEDDMMDDDDL